MKIPKRYIPRNLSRRDATIQKRNIIQTRKLYKKGIYINRPNLKTFHSKKSSHIEKAKKIYKVDSIDPNSKTLSSRTKCSNRSLKKIVNKGEGAYYSSGSRPNQTAKSWGIARLASSITGGPASKIDFKIIEEGCSKRGPAYKMALKTV